MVDRDGASGVDTALEASEPESVTDRVCGEAGGQVSTSALVRASRIFTDDTNIQCSWSGFPGTIPEGGVACVIFTTWHFPEAWDFPLLDEGVPKHVWYHSAASATRRCFFQRQRCNVVPTLIGSPSQPDQSQFSPRRPSTCSKPSCCAVYGYLLHISHLPVWPFTRPQWGHHCVACSMGMVFRFGFSGSHSVWSIQGMGFHRSVGPGFRCWTSPNSRSLVGGLLCRCVDRALDITQLQALRSCGHHSSARTSTAQGENVSRAH